MSYRRSSTYNPTSKTRAILDRAMEHVKSVSYKVSARWVFYRLLQEGVYADKSGYTHLTDILGRARHAFLDEWTPGTLADETRSGVIRGDGFADVDAWITAPVTCNLDKWHNQDTYVEIWFEARAMLQQFDKYTDHITLRPMGGQPSIPFKYEIARELSTRADKDITIIYFGDHDLAGDTIRAVTSEDVTKWTTARFDLVHAGLTMEQVIEHGVQENPDHPGAYQWEALTDEAAKKIIRDAVLESVDQETIDKVVELETIAYEWGAKRQNKSLGEWLSYRKEEGF